MYLTEQEILAQQEALEKTFDAVMEGKEKIREFLSRRKRLVFLGCGSSYMLAKTGQRIFGTKAGMTAEAIAGGEYLIAPDFYQEALKDSIVVALSRSGMTSEIIRAVEIMKDRTNALIFSVTMKEGCDLLPLSDFSLVFPWAYDNSVCQTRTVSNFYGILLMLSDILEQNDTALEELSGTIRSIGAFLEKYRAPLEQLAQRDFKDVVVLADGVLCGIAEEAALAFTEIALISGKYFHLLDYRHGPKVLNGSGTLTVAVTQPGGGHLQQDMVRDLKACGGTLAVLCPQKDQEEYPCDLVVPCPDGSFATFGFYLLGFCQLLALLKALANGTNPDQPQGLDAYITLK